MLKALIFDVDGTLADTEEAHRRAFNEAFARRGLEWRWSKPKYAELLKTTGGKERLLAFARELDLVPAARREIEALIPDLHRVKTEVYTASVQDGVVGLREGAARLIDEAERAGIRLAIASTTTLVNIETLLQATLGPRALGRFAVIGAGDQVARKKPAPDIYRHVLGGLALPPEACVALEDSAHGLAAARGAGLFTVVTPSYWTLGEDFSGADLVLPSFGSAARPLPSRAAAHLGEPYLGVRALDAALAARFGIRDREPIDHADRTQHQERHAMGER